MKDAPPATIPQETIDLAAMTLLQAAPVGSRVILFGSYARGEAGPDSDVDFLVVEPQVQGRRAEMVRLRAALYHLQIPVDVVVVSEEGFQAWRDKVNTLIHEAAHEGKVYEAA